MRSVSFRFTAKLEDLYYDVFQTSEYKSSRNFEACHISLKCSQNLSLTQFTVKIVKQNCSLVLIFNQLRVEQRWRKLMSYSTQFGSRHCQFLKKLFKSFAFVRQLEAYVYIQLFKDGQHTRMWNITGYVVLMKHVVKNMFSCQWEQLVGCMEIGTSVIQRVRGCQWLYELRLTIYV